MQDEFLLHRLFSHLPLREWLVLETVSFSWYQAVHRCWRTVTTIRMGPDVFHSNQREEQEICMILKRCGSHLLQLYFAPVNVRKPFFRNVRRFTARHEISERVLSAIRQYCTTLKILDLSYHIFPTWSVFEILKDLPETVEILLLEICRLDESPNSEDGMTEVMNGIFDRLRHLRIFSVWGSCYGYLALSHSHLTRIPPSLTYLDLSQGFTAKIGDLKSWISPLTNLQQLHLERTSIDDQDLHQLVKTCQATLTGLTLAYAKSIIDFSPIASFTRLRYLRLDGNRDFLNDPALLAICQSCTHLRLLSLENCNRLTVVSLKMISNLKSIRHLSLCSVQTMDDACFIQICSNCIRLRSLQVKYCRKLTQCGLLKLVNLRKLRYLGVSGLACFDQTIAQCTRMKCTKLSTIEAFNCDNYR